MRSFPAAGSAPILAVVRGLNNSLQVLDVAVIIDRDKGWKGSSAMGKLLGIAYRDASRRPMREMSTAYISRAGGVEGDFRGKKGRRQVTVLCLEKWRDACAELGVELPWTTRRANLLVSGLAIGPEHAGRSLQVGQALLRITIETDPCPRMDEQYQGLQRALVPDWRGGACCEVIGDGEIDVGDGVRLID